MDAKVIRRYEIRVTDNTESSLCEKERTKELYPQGWMKMRSLYQVPHRKRKIIKSTLLPPLPQFTSLQKLQFKLKKRDGSGRCDAYVLSSEGSLLLLLIVTIIDADGHLLGAWDESLMHTTTRSKTTPFYK